MTDSSEPITQFEKRKQDHIQLALNVENQAANAGFNSVQLIHEALPDFDFVDVSISSKSLGKIWKTPFLVSSMTAGHQQALNINLQLAEACAAKEWILGVGSQRRELSDPKAAQEWKKLRQQVPNLSAFGNIGITQLITSPLSAIQKLCDSLEASGIFIHLNPLQECLQTEGTPNFAGGFKAIESLCKNLSIPVIIKETGCGFSEKTLKRLDSIGVAAVDLSGYGGTHWGRIEGCRATEKKQQQAAQVFADWGINTVAAMINAIYVKPGYEIWASGGVRNGLDAAKLLAMGAQRIGLAQPILAAALQGMDVLIAFMEAIEFELKIAMFCTGQKSLTELQENQVWQMRA